MMALPYRFVEDHFEIFIQVYEIRYEWLYGFFRSYIQKVICQYLDCGDLHHFPVSAATSAPPIIKSVSWSMDSGCACFQW